jgi:glycosyltransferase involved in cell wall biosynthesis
VIIERVRAWPAQRDYYFAPGLWRIIRRGGWDLVHCQSYHTLVAPLAMLAAQRARLPYVVTFHGGGHSSRLRNALRSVQWAMLRPLLARAARLVAIARFEIALYGQRLRLPAERFVLIPNGADLPTISESSAAPTDERLIVSIGRLEQYKGHQRLIAALPHVLQRCPDVRLRIVGSGPYEAELRRLADQLGVADRVEIGGIPPTERHAMAETIAGAALVTLLSDYETHPIAALEALSLGRPVLVTDTSGLGELASRGWARAIPLKSAPAEVADAILDQLRQPLIPPAIQLPSWDDCAAELLALYGSLIARPSSCAS